MPPTRSEVREILEIIQLPCGPAPPPCLGMGGWVCAKTRPQKTIHGLSGGLMDCLMIDDLPKSTKKAKILPKSTKNDPKSPKIKVRRGPGGPWARSGSHGGPQGSPGARKCPKTTFEAHPGTALWDSILVTFVHFSESFFGYVFGTLFYRIFIDFGYILGSQNE